MIPNVTLKPLACKNVVGSRDPAIFEHMPFKERPATQLHKRVTLKLSGMKQPFNFLIDSLGEIQRRKACFFYSRRSVASAGKFQGWG